MAYRTIRTQLTQFIDGKSDWKDPNVSFIDTQKFHEATEQTLLPEARITHHNVRTYYSDIPQFIREGRSPEINIHSPGGDVITENPPPGTENAIRIHMTEAFEPAISSYTSTARTGLRMQSEEARRRLPILGDLSITIPLYNSTEESSDPVVRISESAAAHGVYYTRTPAMNPIELVTGVPEKFPTPFVPFMKLDYHVNSELLNPAALNKFNHFMRFRIAKAVEPFVEQLRAIRSEDAEPHPSGWLPEYLSQTRLYFNTRFPTKLVYLFDCLVYSDVSLRANYILLRDVLMTDKLQRYTTLPAQRRRVTSPNLLDFKMLYTLPEPSWELPEPFRQDEPMVIDASLKGKSEKPGPDNRGQQVPKKQPGTKKQRKQEMEEWDKEGEEAAARNQLEIERKFLEMNDEIKKLKEEVQQNEDQITKLLQQVTDIGAEITKGRQEDLRFELDSADKLTQARRTTPDEYARILQETSQESLRRTAVRDKREIELTRRAEEILITVQDDFDKLNAAKLEKENKIKELTQKIEDLLKQGRNEARERYEAALEEARRLIEERRHQRETDKLTDELAKATLSFKSSLQAPVKPV